MLIAEFPDGVAIRRVISAEDAAQWRASFAGAYQTIFGGPPFHERFYPNEAEGVWRKLTGTPHNITLLATRGVDQVLGFGIGIPLTAKEPVAKELTGLVPLHHTFYLAELGVLQKYRGLRLGRTLVRERLRLVDPKRFSHVVLRVSTSDPGPLAMYRAMGFEEMGVSMEVSAMRIDGHVTTDRRLFLSMVLSQVRLDG